MPLAYHTEGLDDEVLAAFGIERGAASPTCRAGTQISRAIKSHEGEVTIAVVGKYTGLKDAYKSLVEALAPRRHRQHRQGQPRMDRVARPSRTATAATRLEWVDGILVPGGFGKRGSEGMIRAAGFAREHQVPFFGICFGMQLAVIEAARNLPASSEAQLDRVRPDARSRWSA